MTDPIQHDRKWLKGRSPAEIKGALAAGQLSDVLVGSPGQSESERRKAIADELAPFLKEDADADADVAALLDTPRAPAPTPGQGVSGSRQPSEGTGQYQREDLQRMTPQQVSMALKAGQLNDVLGIKGA